jgi:NhaA family Na+:H+ antiporter
MAAPALIYVAFKTGGEGLAGWAIPTATDIAFALAVLAVIGTHLPAALRTFLLTLAVVDDLLAITIIALFYTGSLRLVPLALALLPLAMFALLVQRRVRSWWLLLPLAAATWVLVHESGVHATVAGVLLGFTVPVIRRRPGPGSGLAEHFEHRFRPLSAGVAVPVFAFFAAGVTIVGTDRFGASLTDSITLGIVVALVVGKTVGVLGSTWLVQRFTHAQLAEGLGWWDVLGIALLGGIGFTVSLLIGELAFGAGTAQDDTVTLGVLLGSRCPRSWPRSSSVSATASTAGLRPRRNATSTGPATGGADCGSSTCRTGRDRGLRPPRRGRRCRPPPRVACRTGRAATHREVPRCER